MKKILVLAAVACLFAAQSCVIRFNRINNSLIWLEANGDSVTRTQTLDGEFTGLSVSAPLPVKLIKGEGPVRVDISASSNIIDYAEVKKDGATLVLKFKDDAPTINLSDFFVTVTMPKCETVSVLGSGTVFSTSPWEGDTFEASVIGSGSMNMSELSFSDISFTLTGSGEMVGFMASRASSVEASCSGSGKITLHDVNSGKVAASISGSGMIDLQGTTDLARYRITGSGIIYAEDLNAVNYSSKVAGSGKVYTSEDAESEDAESEDAESEDAESSGEEAGDEV